MEGSDIPQRERDERDQGRGRSAKVCLIERRPLLRTPWASAGTIVPFHIWRNETGKMVWRQVLEGEAVELLYNVNEAAKKSAADE